MRPLEVQTDLLKVSGTSVQSCHWHPDLRYSAIIKILSAFTKEALINPLEPFKVLK